MSIEIELKLVTTPEGIQNLRAFLQAVPDYFPAKQLRNTYFETPQHTLRQYDFGLRIREVDDHCEMTLKTAGQVVGGLHQRPEYNVPLSTAVLDVSLFPTDIWPEACMVEKLQAELQPLFRTDFRRERWHVEFNHSRIELALDQGSIQAGEQDAPLCEVELELLEGEAEDILAYATQLAQFPGFRLGHLSKAARGYALAAQGGKPGVKPFRLLPVPAKARIEQAIPVMLESILRHWQHHEEVWLAGEVKGEQEVRRVLLLIRQLLIELGGMIPRKATVEIRQDLNALEALLETAELNAQQICFSSESMMAQLRLMRWWMTSAWQAFVTEKGSQKLSGSFKRFSDGMLSRAAAELKRHCHEPLAPTAQASLLPLLQREIHAILLLSACYPRQEVDTFLASWQALAQAIERRNPTAMIEAKRLEALTQKPFWLHSGQQ